MNPKVGAQGGRLAVVTAVAGTVLIACGAFWLSFTALADLARRSGINRGQAWAWPLIVDGIIVVATVAVVALAGQRAAWYPWLLLMVGAGLSVVANSLHAVVTADADVAPILAASVAAVPPLVLLAITHLTVLLTRPRILTEPVSDDGAQAHDVELVAMSCPRTALLAPTAGPTPILESPESASGRRDAVVAAQATAPPESGTVVEQRRGRATRLRAAGWSNKKIARAIGVHPSTVGRWFRCPDPTLGVDAEAAVPEPEPTHEQEGVRS
ncbi:MAG: DUF2637 domain-containing protein [Actinobacteria bacterium]|nr:DUF2637 domain-containing protein [Actinomycetota bacterium]